MIAITHPACANPSSLLAGNYKHPDNKEVLRVASHDKCMYCESKISATYYGDVEHIRPKSHFPELEFTWDNLGYVCAKCNGKKGDQFDVTTPFINPYEEDPKDHIAAIGAIMRPKRGSERGEMTILCIELNRDSLVERRKERIDQLEKSIAVCFRTSNEALKQNALAALRLDAASDKEYSLCATSILRLHEV
jgi:uncharacterized protein (TIGR02646 family)